MKTWKLGYEGFIMQYMVAGPRTDSFFVRTDADTQLEMEAQIKRHFVPAKRAVVDPVRIRLGQRCSFGSEWKPYVPVSNSFVDCPAFASGIMKVSIQSAACVISPKETDARIRIWTYMATRVYLNGEEIAFFDHSVYKPMMHRDITVHLKQGDNLFFSDSRTVAARDTRVIIGIQFLDHRDDLRVKLADDSHQDEVFEMADFMNSLKIDGSDVVFPKQAPEGVSYSKEWESEDYYVVREFKREWIDVSGKTRFTVPEDCAKVEIRLHHQLADLSRTLEFYDRRHPSDIAGDPDPETNKRIMFREIANVRAANRGGRFGFCMTNLLARHYMGISDPRDRDLLFDMLDLIERRVDCAEFEICGFVRYLKQVPIDEDLAARAKEVLLNYRYWQTQPGLDAMCFWSENHALMYYSCQLLVGEMYPDDFFPTANMTGRELSSFGYRNTKAWLEDVLKTGFEEFLSAVYLNVSLAALLNIVDYADGELSAMAVRATDEMMEKLAVHTFKGAMISPMGRVYRGVLYPFSAGSQGLVRLIDYQAPRAYGEGWIAFLTGSKYRFKNDLLQKMHDVYSGSYSIGNALITLEKQKDFCLTSVQSPRLDGYVRWPNVRNIPGIDKSGNDFCRSQNESFHGTSYFQPGTFGYMQHMWYAALSPEAVVFVNHPGCTSERSSMRPGYWNGNAVMPAVKQDKNILGVIHNIPEETQILFTHMFLPEKKFDEVDTDGNWFFMKKDGGYIGLWSSFASTPHDEMIFGCEYRFYNRNTAFFCVTGGEREAGSFEEFKGYAKHFEPSYSEETAVLSVDGKAFLKYEKGFDDTQYLD